VIIELAGRPISNADGLEAVLSALTVGDPVSLSFLRDGQRMETQVTP
jgi:S1-C subfamily serine protease